MAFLVAMPTYVTLIIMCVMHRVHDISFEENIGGFSVFKLLSSGSSPQNVSLFHVRPGSVVFLLPISVFLSFVVDLPTMKYEVARKLSVIFKLLIWLSVLRFWHC